MTAGGIVRRVLARLRRLRRRSSPPLPVVTGAIEACNRALHLSPAEDRALRDLARAVPSAFWLTWFEPKPARLDELAALERALGQQSMHAALVLRQRADWPMGQLARQQSLLYGHPFTLLR